MAKAPQQHLFVSNRDITITSTQGYSIFFQKGVPTHVPRAMHPEVMEKGVLPSDEDGKTRQVSEQPVDEPKVLIEPEDAEERSDAIEKVIREMVARNNPRDFSAGGVPSAAVLTAALGWRVDQKEVRPIWAKIKPDIVKAG